MDGLAAKVELRKAIPVSSEGRLFVPYAGFADIAKAMEWDTDRISGVDDDAAAVRYWNREFPSAEIIEGRAERFAFGDHEYCAADIDAYGDCYRSLKHFLLNARKRFPLVVFLTDGLFQARTQAHRYFCWESGRMKKDSEEAARHGEEMDLIVRGWLEADGYEVGKSGFISGEGASRMLYMGYSILSGPQPGEGTGAEVSEWWTQDLDMSLEREFGGSLFP